VICIYDQQQLQTMGSLSSKLFHDKPFPDNAGALHVMRPQERTTAAYGPSKMPHVQRRKTFPSRDAMGRIIIEDGMNRLYAGWPPSHVGIFITPMRADFIFSTLLYNTEDLNTYMKKHNMLAFCLISSHEVLMLIDIPYEKACEKQANLVATGKKHAEHEGIKAMAHNLATGPNRLTETQLQKVVVRLCNAYREFGVGALIMHEDKFSYYVMVPNEKDYAIHKTMYDKSEMELRKNDNIRYTSSKRTRSGKQFDKYNN